DLIEYSIKSSRTNREIRVCMRRRAFFRIFISTRLLEEFVSDGKLSSQGTPPDSIHEESEAPAGFRPGVGRFRSPAVGASDLSAFVPEEDEAVALIARRFRAATAGKPQAQSESLDQQLGEQKSADVGHLADF